MSSSPEREGQIHSLRRICPGPSPPLPRATYPQSQLQDGTEAITWGRIGRCERERDRKVKDLTCACIRPREGRKDTLPPTQEHLLCWAQAAKFSPNVLMLAGPRASLWGWRGSDGMQTRWVGGGRGLFYSSNPAMEKGIGRELLLRALLSGRHLFTSSIVESRLS